MTATLDILVSPTDRAGMYRAEVDGRHVVTARTPLFAAARVLQDEGVSPETPLSMRWAGSEIDALRSTVGAAAALTVTEDAYGTRFATYRPGPGARMPSSTPASDRQRPAALAEAQVVAAEISRPSWGGNRMPQRCREAAQAQIRERARKAKCGPLAYYWLSRSGIR